MSTHIVGGEMFYDYLGGDSFKITLHTYIDCINGQPGALASDAVAHFGIFSGSTYATIDSFKADTLRTVLIKDVNYNCLIPPTDVCVVQYQYEYVVELPDLPGGYIISYQRCCRNGTVQNVQDQDITGATFWTAIPERFGRGKNSSPRFKQLPPNFLCLNNPFSFKHDAVDPDGDSLVYSLCIPFNGASQAAPYPLLPSNPAYSNVVMRTGFGVNNFMNAKPKLKIDSKTGELTCVPRRLGQYAVGICVEEYRNGVLLSTVTRDFQFNVINCQFDVVTAFSIPEQACEFEVEFKNETTGAVRYFWDFGDENTDADTSVQRTAKYTYPSPGFYDIELIGFSTECSDTFRQRIFVKPDTGAFAGPDVRSCYGESVQIGPLTTFPNAKYKWFPSQHLNNDTIQNPTANPPSDFTYVLRQTFEYCYGWDTLLVEVGPPEVDFDFDALVECSDMTYAFDNTTNEGTYRWDFGDGQTSTDENPYHTYAKEGSYTIKLVSFVNPTCGDSLEKVVQVVQDTSDFAGLPRIACFGDTFRLGQIPVNNKARYAWTPAKNILDSTEAQPLVVARKTGNYIVKRYTDYCEVYDTVFVDVDDPEPFFQLAYTAPCDGLNVKVYNRSTNIAEYLWDFGVLTSNTDTASASDSVSFAYKDNGDYTIRLTGTSAKGCEDFFELPLNVFADTAQFAGPDSNLCRFQELQIGLDDSISFANFRWSPKDSVSDYQIPNPTVKPWDTMTYVLEKIYPECTFVDSVTVGVHFPIADFGTDYDPHCDLFDISLENRSRDMDLLIWDFGDDQIISTDDTIEYTFRGAGDYTLILYAFKEQCGDTISRDFTAFVDTGVTLIPDSVICLTDSLFLGAADTATRVRYQWTPGDFLSSDTISNPQAWPEETTVYTFQRIFPKCTYTGTVEVRVANPIASFDTFIRPDCYGYRAEFTNTSQGAVNYRWVFSSDTTTTNTDEVLNFPYGDAMEATLYATDAHCATKASISRQLEPFENFEIIRPNIFTPNGDGYNDCFSISIPRLPPECKNFEVVFFNRWGQELFTIEQEGNTLCWDGTNAKNEEAVSPGVYFYMVKVLGREFTGSVQLVR